VKFAIDKQAHFWWGWAIAATFQSMPLVAAALVAAAAIGKELWDKRGHGTPELADCLATLAGGVAALAFVAIIGVSP
jgi:hypothetical protein